MIPTVSKAILLLAMLLTATLALAAGHHVSPKEVVNLFLQVYGTEQMAEILPHTSLSFRESLPPGVWLKRTSTALDRLGYVRLDAVIQSAVIKGNKATVVVGSRIKTNGATTKQTEIYFLRYTNQGWQLVDLEVQDEMLIDVTATEVG